MAATVEVSAKTAGMDLYLSTFREGRGRKPSRPKILHGTAIEDITLCEFTWVVQKGDGAVKTAPSPALEDVNGRVMIGGRFSARDLFPAMSTDLSRGGEFQIAATAAVERGILRFELFSQRDGGPFLDITGEGDNIKIEFKGEGDPARAKRLLRADPELVKNNCEREWVALMLRSDNEHFPQSAPHTTIVDNGKD